MKLKAKIPQQSAAGGPKPGGAAIADRLRLDVDPRAAKKSSNAGVSAKSAMCALLAALAVLALVGLVGWLMYQDWEYVQSL